MMTILVEVSDLQLAYVAFSVLIVGLALAYAIQGGRDKRYAPPSPLEPDEEKRKDTLVEPEKPDTGKGG